MPGDLAGECLVIRNGVLAWATAEWLNGKQILCRNVSGNASVLELGAGWLVVGGASQVAILVTVVILHADILLVIGMRQLGAMRAGVGSRWGGAGA